MADFLNYIGLDMHTLLTGMIVFFARIADVSLGTFRTIIMVHGRTVSAFILKFIETVIWMGAIGTVVSEIKDAPILILFYSLGCSVGTVTGIMVERKMALGLIILRVISVTHGREIAEKIRAIGQPVTVFKGEGMHGPVLELYVVCKRRSQKKLLTLIKGIDPQAFYITEQARDVSKVLQPVNLPVTGWRAVFKRK